VRDVSLDFEDQQAFEIACGHPIKTEHKSYISRFNLRRHADLYFVKRSPTTSLSRISETATIPAKHTTYDDLQKRMSATEFANAKD